MLDRTSDTSGYPAPRLVLYTTVRSHDTSGTNETALVIRTAYIDACATTLTITTASRREEPAKPRPAYLQLAGSRKQARQGASRAVLAHFRPIPLYPTYRGASGALRDSQRLQRQRYIASCLKGPSP